MGKSYKEPWVKDPANSYMKRIHNRRVRRSVNQILHVFKKNWDSFWWFVGEGSGNIIKSSPEPEIPDPKSVTNQYDICDYIFYDSSPKGKRK
jgi:hypothetical protein